MNLGLPVPTLGPNMGTPLVNAIALTNCVVRLGDATAKVLDLSHVRVVIEPKEPWLSALENEPLEQEFALDRYSFKALAAVVGKGDDWIRLGFEKIAPSARSHLKSFLSPKKIGESIISDWHNENLRHYHGLNESEVWFDPHGGGILFTYLDQLDLDAQFIIRMSETKGPLRVGKILRKDYMELNSLDSELPLIPLGDREIYTKLSECRDIVTNIRPTAQNEYSLKQRLLRAISESLYSTSHRVEMQTRPVRSSAPPPET